MKTMKWLLQREFWEHKGAMFWAPVIVGALMVAFMGATLIYSALSSDVVNASVNINGHHTDIGAILAASTPAQREGVASFLAAGYLAAAAPLFLMMTVIAFFYCLGALHDERRDRSILFWKSLPLSDQMTVLSKVLTALVVAPVITIAVATLASVALLLIACIALAFLGVNVFGLVLSQPALYLTPLQLIALLPIYALWALPTVGWLLMVSAWARSKVFLWAVGTPLLLIAIVKWAEYLLGVKWDIDWFVQHIIGRGLSGLVPGVWLPLEHIDPDSLLSEPGHALNVGSVVVQSWMILAKPAAWIGAIVGGAMIFAAMRLRRWKDEG